MKLVFKKNEDDQISVFQVVDGSEQDFSYVDMIKALIKSKKMDAPEISSEFSGAESKSINTMVQFINKRISATEAPESKL